MIQLKNQNPSEKEPAVTFRNVGVDTSFTVKDGETIVLGASQIRENRKTKTWRWLPC